MKDTKRLYRAALVVLLLGVLVAAHWPPGGAPGLPAVQAAAGRAPRPAGGERVGPPPPRPLATGMAAGYGQIPLVHTVCPAGPPACDYGTIQEAVDAAGTGDLIKVAAGVYDDLHARPAPPGYIGPGTITQVVYLSKTVTIQGGYTVTNWLDPDPVSHPTTLDARGQGRVLFVGGAVQPTIAGLRLTGGDAAGLGGTRLYDQAGGGVYLISATAVLSDNQVFSNTAGRRGAGGGLYLFRSGTELYGNTVATNHAGSDGGGVFTWLYDGVLVDNLITANRAITWGGGLFMSDSPALLDGNVVQANQAPFGSGLCMTGSDGAVLRDNAFIHNVGIAAGGMYMGYTGWTTRALVISNTFAFNESSGIGAGIYLMYVPSDFVGNLIAGNEAPYAAGLYSFSGDACFEGNTFRDNRATYLGGGMYVEYTYQSTITGNLFVGNSAGAGGGLLLEGCTGLVGGNAIVSNTAQTGGGVAIYGSSPLFEGNVVTANQAISAAGMGLFGSPATLEGNLIGANRADLDGGGLYLSTQSDARLANNVIAGNQAGGDGAGVYVQASWPHLLHTTVARNGGPGGSGVCVDGSGAVSLSNTIVVSHGVGITVAAGCTATLEATLWGNGVDWAGPGYIVTGTVNLWGNPAFADPDRGDYHLAPGSAAIDAGVAAGVRWDLDGQPRPVGAGYDLGADEFPAALRLFNRGTPDPVSIGAPLTYTLRVTNSGLVALQATITDVLPAPVSPTGVLTWTAQITPGGVWTETLVVTVDPGCTGPLTNVLAVATDEGPAGRCTATVSVSPTCRPITGLGFVPTQTVIFSPTTFVPIVTPSQAPGPLTYTWDFGDGSPPVTDPRPVHSYDCGPNRVSLTVSNACSQRTVSQSVEVLMPPCCIPPEAGFTYTSPLSVGVPVTFTNVTTWCTVYPITYTWDFGDGSPLVAAVHPTHTYTASGRFTVVLTASLYCGCDQSVTGVYTETLTLPGEVGWRVYLPVVWRQGG